MAKLLPLICSFLFLAAFTLSAPGTSNRSSRPGSPILDEAPHGLSTPAVIEKRAISVGSPYVAAPIRYVAIFYDRSGYVRILMPTLITSELLNLFPLGNQVESLYLSVLDGFMSNPVLSQLSNWRAVQASVSFANPTDAGLLQLPGTVANLCINLNLLPIIRSYNQYARPGTAEMDPLMTELLRDYVIPYWFGSPGAHVVGLDPRQVNVEWNYVPSARLVADATTYVFSYLTPPPGSPSRKVMDHNNLTITGNSTQVATLKTANSTGHLDTNITKRASITCQDFYPNILPFLQGGPMTTVGTDTISCAA